MKILLNCRSFFEQPFKSATVCELCLEQADHSGFLCVPCYSELPHSGLACSQCAEPANHPGRCGRCQASPPAFDYGISFYHYEGAIAHWLRQAKDKRQHQAQRRLVWLMTHHDQYLYDTFNGSINEQVDGLIAVPSSRLKLLTRGFNLAEILATAISTKTRIPVIDSGIQRRSSRDQRHLNANARKLNQRQALRPSEKDFSGKHLLIIDDVLTTGATADALALQLKKQGAAIVGVLTLARTPQR